MFIYAISTELSALKDAFKIIFYIDYASGKQSISTAIIFF